MRRSGVLGERDLRNLYCARAFSLIGDGIVPVALAFGVLQTANSATALGTVLAARSLTLVTFLLIGGVVADRLPRRSLMIGSDMIRFAAQAATAAIVISRPARVWEIAALAVVYGFGNAFFLPTSAGIIPQTVSAGRLQQTNALISLTQNACTIAGPVLASLIIVTIGTGWAFAVDAVTFGISAFFISRLPMIRLAQRPGTRFFSDLREGWRAFRSRRWLLIDGIASALGSFAVLASFLTLGPVVAQDHCSWVGTAINRKSEDPHFYGFNATCTDTPTGQWRLDLLCTRYDGTQVNSYGPIVTGSGSSAAICPAQNYEVDGITILNIS